MYTIGALMYILHNNLNIIFYIIIKNYVIVNSINGNIL